MTNVQQGRNVADRKYGHKVRCERKAEYRVSFLFPGDSSFGIKEDHWQVNVTAAACISVVPAGKTRGGVSRGIIISLSPINR